MTKEELYNILITEQINEVIDRYFSEEKYEELIQSIFSSMNIINPTFLGKGFNGVAYKSGNFVIKITKDASEAEIKHGLMGTTRLKHLPKVFSTHRINLESLKKYGYGFDDDLYIIKQEYAQELNSEWTSFFILLHHLLEGELDYLDIVSDYIREFEDIKQSMIKKTGSNPKLLNEFYELLMEMYKLKIDSIDFKADNFGMGKSGNLIFFDIGFGSGGLYIKDEIII